MATGSLWERPSSAPSHTPPLHVGKPTGAYSGVYGVIGPPGTGKTTFLAAQVRRIVETMPGGCSAGYSPVLVSSLTKAAASEIAGRELPLPKGAVGTLHAHAYRALGQPEIATGKVLEAWNEAYPDYALSVPSRVRPTANRDDLDGDVVVETTVAEDSGNDMPGDKYLAVYDLLRAKMVPREEWDHPDPSMPVMKNTEVRAGALSRFVDLYEEWKTRAGVFDFTDLISGALELPPPLNPDVLIVDEVQDLSELEWALVSAWAEGRALFAVGDPWQALYTWRGAHPELFDSIPKERLKVLSRSYRVPATVVETSLRFMDGRSGTSVRIRYEPRLGQNGLPVPGRIDFKPDLTPRRVEGLIDLVEESLARGRTAMIQATCSYMLIDVLSALRRRGIPFANPWRARRGDWNPISARGVPVSQRFAAFLVPLTEHRLWTWEELSLWTDSINVRGTLVIQAKKRIESLAHECGGNVPNTKIELAPFFVDDSVFQVASRIHEKGMSRESIDIAKDWFISRIPKAVGKSIDYAARILARYGVAGLRDKPKVYVGTCHSFKGAEADDVYLFTELSGAALRGVLGKAFDADPIGSIARTLYVGMTRTRETLTICGTSNRADSSYPVFKYLRAAADGVV